MLTKFKTLALAVLTAGVAAQASAQTAVTDRTQIAGGQTFSWAGHGSSNPFSTTLGSVGMDVSSNNGGGWHGPCQAGICWGGGFTDGETILFGFNASTYTFNFGTSITAFATQAWFNSGGAGPDITVNAFLGANSAGSFNFTTGGGGASNSNQASVVGLQNNGGFDRLEISSAGSEFAINDVTFAANTTVPEPSTVALLAAGLAAAGLVARRRRSV